MKHDLSVVIVTHNSAHVIGDLLDSLPPALGGLTADVVAVDNASSDKTAEILGARDDCHLVRSPNVGYAGGINLGIQAAAEADAYLILNPDVRLLEDSIPPLLEALQQPGTGIVVPQLHSADGLIQPSLRRRPTLLRAMGLERTRIPAFAERIHEAKAYQYPHAVDWAQGAVLMMSRACHEALGGWDESFFLYSEEVDVSLRASDAGMLTRYEPRSIAVHIGGQSGQTDATHAMQIINRIRLYRRRHDLVRSWCYYWLHIASEISWLLRGQRSSRYAIKALLCPPLRPVEIGCSDRLIPR